MTFEEWWDSSKCPIVTPDTYRGGEESCRQAWFAGSEQSREQTLKSEGLSWALMCEKMVAAEREACSKVCESLTQFASPDGYDQAAIDCAAAIMARSNAAPQSLHISADNPVVVDKIVRQQEEIAQLTKQRNMLRRDVELMTEERDGARCKQQWQAKHTEEIISERDKLLRVVEAVDKLIEYQYTGTRDGMSALQEVAFSAHDALAKVKGST
jgi:hypothetical protein